jgi:hypothetical protein
LGVPRCASRAPTVRVEKCVSSSLGALAGTVGTMAAQRGSAFAGSSIPAQALALALALGGWADELSRNGAYPLAVAPIRRGLGMPSTERVTDAESVRML